MLSAECYKNRTTPARPLRGTGAGVACRSLASSNSIILRGGGRLRLRAGGCRRIDADELALPPLVLELHDAVNEREERVVLAATDVLAGLPLRPALAREDVAAQDLLAAELLQAEPLRVGVAPVARGADAFFVCQDETSFVRCQ